MAQEDQGFKVSDRRLFNPDGTLRHQSEEASEEPDSRTASSERGEANATDNIVSFPGPAKKAQSAADPREHSREHGQPASLPPPSFAGFINMLAVETAMHLGLVENPMEGGASVDLEAARHMIDTLDMLREKTRGNLTPAEADLLESILAELQMQFVAQSRGR